MSENNIPENNSSEQTNKTRDSSMFDEALLESTQSERKSFKEGMAACLNATKNFFVNFPTNTKNFFVNFPRNSKNLVKSIPNRKWFNSITSSVVASLIGILFGFLLMIVFISFKNTANPIRGLGAIFSGPFTGRAIPQKFGDMIMGSVPIIFTGLSVAIAYKTGLFNIGAPGQFLMGTMGALMIALNVQSTTRVAGVFVWILSLLIAIIFAILWALIPGFLKAQFGINEVISCIMTNWVAANIFTWVFKDGFPYLHDLRFGKDASFLLPVGTTNNYTPYWFFDKMFEGSKLDISIIIAIIIAIFIWIMLNKTTLGYTLKACGYNRNAAKYAGINEKLNIMIAMGIAGALAGLGGALLYLNREGELNYAKMYMALPDEGFNGIPVALLANSNPIGVMFTAVFIKYIGSANLTASGYNQYISDIIIAVIIYLSGFSRFFAEKIEQIKKHFAKNIDDANKLNNESSTKEESNNNGVEESKTEKAKL